MDLICPLCLFHYDTNVYCPRVLSCGHTICSCCLVDFKGCPIDNAPLTWVHDPPKNYTLIDIILSGGHSGGQSAKGPNPPSAKVAKVARLHCDDHGNEVCAFDVQCQKLLCVACMTSNHSGHICQPLSAAAIISKGMLGTSKIEWDAKIDQLRKEDIRVRQQMNTLKKSAAASTDHIRACFVEVSF